MLSMLAGRTPLLCPLSTRGLLHSAQAHANTLTTERQLSAAPSAHVHVS